MSATIKHLTALIFATPREANPFLTKAGLTTLESGLFFDLRPERQLVVCICGMGSTPALEHTRRLITDYPVTSVINAGIAGAVTGDKKPGELFRITGTRAWPSDHNSIPCDSTLFADLRPAVLATVEKPVFDPILRRDIATHADLVDMEGAAIANACREHGVPFCALKGVSDLAGEGDRKTLFANLDPVAEAIAECLWQQFMEEGLK